ncbi:tRNA (adenosine(37)-N6)-threonylcarbamoyltransferase complex dimerization subunit type 1 TsaB [Fructobacillus ficulneus]|uniref:Glycoprotein endopeptidase n=1 Tax=Fructobacillus ficulneus TaxID=157463 RepID=A0A0K8MFT7_9LACO|nr:tRNA (adenosine(37)-N6)-threonylcarbamoyltransferase complex dimerization subunit type 1 TsaB [Fructobacillus ficulneus]GAO99352.1 glycoprotein endopeptidase [Fructobacillus ficulneus]
MKILLIDTSNQPLFVGLADGDEIVESFATDKVKNHSIDLLPAIKNALASQGWTLQDLDRIAIAKGPGSFTGLRIGVTVGKVLADTLQKPLVAISSLHSLAKQVQTAKDQKLVVAENAELNQHPCQLNQNTVILALFDARNNNVFAGAYLADTTVLADGHYPLEEVLDLVNQVAEPVVVVGDGAHFTDQINEALANQAVTILDHNQSLPNGRGLLDLAKEAEVVSNIADLTPSYLRKTQAELNWEQNHQEGQDKPYVFEV